MKATEANTASVHFTRFPVISLAAEHLVMGHLMRRNIMTYKAPPNNEGYDLICIPPETSRRVKPLRIQVKSRLATDCDRGFVVNKKTFSGFDYLTVVFLNVGYFLHKRQRQNSSDGLCAPEFYTFPRSFILRHHNDSSSWEKVRLGKFTPERLKRYRDDQGFEQVAVKLDIPYPQKPS